MFAACRVLSLFSGFNFRKGALQKTSRGWPILPRLPPSRRLLFRPPLHRFLHLTASKRQTVARNEVSPEKVVKKQIFNARGPLRGGSSGRLGGQRGKKTLQGARGDAWGSERKPRGSKRGPLGPFWAPLGSPERPQFGTNCRTSFPFYGRPSNDVR